MRRFFLLLFCLLTLGGQYAEGGGVSGEVTMEAGKYRTENDGQTVDNGNFFSQQYGLFYRKDGKFLDGRGGDWKVALGQEWSGINGRINGDEFDLQSSKFLYDGRLFLAPGGLPFRLTLFARDYDRSKITQSQLMNRSVGSTGSGQTINADMVDDFIGQQRKILGATFFFGIKNGSYLGEYRDIMSQLPRLLIDYKQEEVTGLSGLNRQHYLMRDLAFVSLNKKDNWFHYRLSDYVDYVDPDNDYSEKTVMLGTVDSYLHRNWINLTNWIKLSADGSWKLLKGVNRDSGQQESYVFNAFANARRGDFSLFTPMNFERRIDDNLIERDFNAPLVARGKLSERADWRFNFVYDKEEKDYSVDDLNDVVVDDLAVKGGVEWRGRGLVGDVSGAVERYQSHRGEALTLQGSLLVHSVGGGYRASSYSLRLTGVYQGGESYYLENIGYREGVLDFDAETRLSPQLRVGTHLQTILGRGNADQTLTRQIAVRGIGMLSYTNTSRWQRYGGVTHHTGEVFGEYQSQNGVLSRLSLTADILDNHVGAGEQYIATFGSNYKRAAVGLQTTNSYVLGESSGNNGSPVTLSKAERTAEHDFRHSAGITYAPRRSYDIGLNEEFGWRSGDGWTYQEYLVRENFTYRFFTFKGLVRQLANINQILSVRKMGDGTLSVEYAEASLEANLFPTSYWSLGGKFERRVDSKPSRVVEDAYKLYTALNFPQLVVDLSYSAGIVDKSYTNGLPTTEQKDNRWLLQIKKTF